MQSKKILVICPYPKGVAPSQRLKYEQYFDFFSENGFEITMSSFMTLGMWKVVYKRGNYLAKVLWTLLGYSKRVYDLLRLRKYDVVYVHLWVTPFGMPIFEWIYSLLAKKIIYDIDDLVFLKTESKINPLIQLFKTSYKPILLMKKANHVITCTPYLDEFVSQYNKNTTDISSTINTDTYQPINKYRNDTLITIGWSGSFSTSKYVYLLEEVLSQVNKKFKFKLLIIGDASFTLDSIECEAVPWSQESEVSDLQRIDIGLYPLPNEQWVHGKSGLKALQYMALGIPTIATSIGANYRVIENSISGFLVNDDQEWTERLIELIENPTLRKSIGEQARKRVETMYSIHANRKTYLSILTKTLN